MSSSTDGRGIDPSIGLLTGEGSQQLTGSVHRRVETIEPLWDKPPAIAGSDITYYDRPLLKEPVWEWAVPLYYFVGGTAGASLVIGAAAQLDRSGKLNDLVRRCHWAGIVGSTVSGGLLIYDLGRPSRFLNMLRVFRPTSPMNMGVWILTAAAPAAIAAAIFAKRPGVWGLIGECCGLASGLFGLGLSTYTGVLVGNSVIPIWQESRFVLPILFGASAMASMGSIFDLFGEDPRARRITNTFGTAGRVAELAAEIVMERHIGRIPQVAEPLKQGASGAMWKAAAALTAGSLIVSLLPSRSKKKRVLAGVLGVMGSLMMRFAVHQAGVASARDPRASFRQQSTDL